MITDAQITSAPPAPSLVAQPETVPVVVEVSNLVKKYGSFTAVNGISLSIKQNEIFGILGPNGAGKTTTLEMFEGIRKPDGGSIRVLGYEVPRQSRQLHQRIGVQLQSTSLWEDLTVEETITLYASFYPQSLSVATLLDNFNLEEKRKTMTKDLSGGQRQRLSLALAIVNQPPLIFLDEPTSALDPAARRLMWDQIVSLRAQGKTIIMTTHYMEEAEYLCDRIAIMDSGKIIALDTPQGLIASLQTDRTIECSLGGAVPIGDLQRLNSVVSVKDNEGLFTIYTSRADATLRDLLAYTEAHNLSAADLRLRSATLEDVYLSLTGKKLRD